MMMMNNVRKELKRSREVCPGLSDGAYYFMDYMSYMANDTLLPEGMEMAIKMCIYDILKKQNNTRCPESQESFEYLTRRPGEVLESASKSKDVIYQLASKEFAEAFEKLYNENALLYPALAML